jgi:hypothetical protein
LFEPEWQELCFALIEGEKLYKSWKMADESKKGEIKSWLIYTYS